MQYINLFTYYNNQTYYYIEKNYSNNNTGTKRNLLEFDHQNYALKLLAVNDGYKNGEQ